MATLKRKGHVVLATAPSDLVGAALASSHFRMLATVAAITITFWFLWSTLYTKCDFEDETVLTRLDSNTLFKKNPDEDYVGQSIHWLECTNTTNKYKTKIAFNQSFVEIEWAEKDEYKCIRDDAKIGRDTTHVALILMLSLVAAGALLQLWSFYMMRGRSNHVKVSAAVTITHLFVFIIIVGALWYVQNYAYYSTIDDDKRDIKAASWHLWTILITSSIGSGVFMVLYMANRIRTLQMYFGTKSDEDVERTNSTGYVIDNGDVNPKGTSPFKYRYVRTDTLISQYAHEKLTMAFVLAAVAIVASMAIRIHDDEPGVRQFEIVHGDRLRGIVTGANETPGTPLPLFAANCTPGEPFTMNVTMHNRILSTKHHIKHHVDDHGHGVIAVLSIFGVTTLIEIALTVMVWMQQTFKLTHAFDAVTGTYSKDRPASEMPLMDIFFSWVPLVTQLLGSLGLSLMVLLVGYGVVFGEHELRHWLLSGCIVGTLTFLVHNYHFAIFLQHKVFHPRPKSDAAGKKSP
jgi:hypothetical protein